MNTLAISLFSFLQLQNSGQPASPMLKRCAAVLDPLTKAAPGLLQGLYLMAKVRYLSGTEHDRKQVMCFFI